MKQNKLLAVLLALLLCAMLPLSAMAATEYSFQLIPGDDMASVDAIKDLFDVLTVRFLKGEGSGMLTLSLSGEDVFSAATRMTGDGLYLDSAILGDKPVYASAEDIGQVLTQLATADESADEEMVSQIKPMIAQLFSQAGMMNELKGTALADPSVNLPDETFNSEEMRAQIKEAFADDEAMADYVLGILDRAEITEGSFTSEAHDPATQSIKITLTKDDVATLQSSTTVQKMLTDSGSMTEEEAAAELKKAMDNMEKMDVVMTMYADDSHLVALEMTMDSAMTVTDDDGEAERESVQMTAAYNRLTEGRRCESQRHHDAGRGWRDRSRSGFRTHRQGRLLYAGRRYERSGRRQGKAHSDRQGRAEQCGQQSRRLAGHAGGRKPDHLHLYRQHRGRSDRAVGLPVRPGERRGHYGAGRFRAPAVLAAGDHLRKRG